jgi:hypothetical protein
MSIVYLQAHNRKVKGSDGSGLSIITANGRNFFLGKLHKMQNLQVLSAPPGT